MLLQAIKQEISNYFKKQNYQVLDLFYKMPCNLCITVENWDKFDFFPDILLKKDSTFNFCFIILIEKEIFKCNEFIKQHSFIKNYKIYLYKDNAVYEYYNEKYILISKDINPLIEKFNSVAKTYKSKNDKFAEVRQMGKLGEDKLANYFKQTNKKYFNLNFNAPCDTCSEPENWRKFNKLPDGILLEGEKIFFFEAKSKRNRLFIINERDYKEYLDKNNFFQVRVFFLIFDYNLLKCKEVFYHDVIKKDYPTNKQKDGNITLDVSSNIIQIQ